MNAYALMDIARSGVENMAIDQAMLDAAAAQQCVILRVYRWAEPTLSLGYFQTIVERQDHPPSMVLPMVRRATGGGAIVHHYDLTYAVAVPDSLLCMRTPSRKIGSSRPLYDCVHSAMVKWLQAFGLPAQLWDETCKPSTENQSPTRASFLCFERRSCGDVVINDRKVMGSAQRRRPGALLQHGSLLLESSRFAPSLLGLSELGGRLGGTPEKPAVNGFEIADVFICLKEIISEVLGYPFVHLPHLDGLPLENTKPHLEKFASRKWSERC